MSRFFILNGNYVETTTDLKNWDDGRIPVPQRPAAHWDWDDKKDVWAEGAVPPKYPDLASARVAMVAFVDDFMSQVTGPIPEYERASWPSKAEAARAYEAGTPRADQTAMITNEAATSGRTEAEVASIIVARADQYQEVIAHSAGLRVATDLALEAATDPSEYETILVNAKAQAMALAKSLGLTVSP